MNRDGVPVPLCHLRLIAGSYEEVGVFADPSANPLAFTDVPVTTGADPTEGTIQVFCAYGLSGCEATFSAVWSGGSLADVPLDEFGFGSGFEVVEGGTTTVTVDIACTPTPSSPPPPPGCCPEVFWCAEGGGTVSHPVGPRPDGVVGRPKRNQSQAERECPPVVPPPVPPVVACTPECDVPGQVYVNFLDRTGGAVEDWPNSVLMEVETADANLVVLRGDASGGFWRRQVRMWFLCDGQVWLTFCGEDPAVTGLTNMASSTGWDYDISGPLAQCPATGTTVYHPASFGDCWADLGYPHEVGTFGFPASPDGTFRMVLTLP